MNGYEPVLMRTNRVASDSACNSGDGSELLLHVDPQRPEGGPDGGRDIEAIRDGIEVWGAVGFQNSVSDSPDDKRNAKAKFIKDLETGAGPQAGLEGLCVLYERRYDRGRAKRTQGFQARQKGITFVDLYWQERSGRRLRTDSARGLAYRYQYLAMSMSEAEQAAFFSRFGIEVHEAITQQHESVISRLDRLEFLHQMSRPLRELRVLCSSASHIPLRNSDISECWLNSCRQ